MKVNLFNDYEAMTKRGQDISVLISEFIHNIINDNKDCDVHQLVYIANMAITGVGAEIILMRAMNKRKMEKENRRNNAKIDKDWEKSYYEKNKGE